MRSPRLGTNAALVFTAANLDSGNSLLVDQQTVYDEFRLVSDLLALYFDPPRASGRMDPAAPGSPAGRSRNGSQRAVGLAKSRQGRGFAVQDALASLTLSKSRQRRCSLAVQHSARRLTGTPKVNPESSRLTAFALRFDTLSETGGGGGSLSTRAGGDVSVPRFG